MNRAEITPTVAMYLRIVYDLQEDGVDPRRARICERTGYSKPSVAQMVLRMRKSGLVDIVDDSFVVLTPEGREHAVIMTRRHRLAERMLVDIVGVPRLDAHRAASGWENTMDDAIERHIASRLDNPTIDAWGNPIPGLFALGIAGDRSHVVAEPLTRIHQGTTATGVVRSFSENLLDQSAALAELVGAGIEPGTTITATKAGTSMCIEAERGSVQLPMSIACSIHLASPVGR